MKFTSKLSIDRYKLMKIAFSQIAMAIVFTGVSYAHTCKAQHVLDSSISISLKAVRLDKALKVLEQQTGVPVIYSSTFVPTAREVTLQAKLQPLRVVLDSLLTPDGITYSFSNNRIVLSPAAEKGRETPTQQVTIRGVVTNNGGQPLPGVVVLLKGSQKGTTTDTKGNYSLSLPHSEGVLIFKLIGFSTMEVAIDGRNTINVQMQEEATALTDVVVVGYGTQKKASLTGAISSVTNKELKTATNSNIANMLAGKLPGLRVTQRNSEPGSYATDFDIRGFGSPLMIVDGVPRDNFTRLDPNEIESISVLKDASAAVYGVKAANGVILITTKKGKTGKTELTYSGTTGWASIANSPHVLNAYQYATLIDESDFNSGKTTPTYSKEALGKLKDGTTPGTDWYDLVVRKQAPIRQHNLSASGGGDKIKYFLSLGYYDEKGMWKSGDLNYKRYNIRSNINAQITKNLDAELLLNGIQDNKMEPGEPTWVVFKSMWMQIPTIPVYANNNPLYLSNVADGTHPLAVTTSSISGYNKTVGKTFQGSFALNYNIPFVDGLKARGMYSYDSKYLFTKSWKKQFALYDYNNATDVYTPKYSHSPSNLSEGFDQLEFSTLQLSLNYQKRIAQKHNINALLLFEKLRQRIDNFNASRQFSLNDIDQMNAGNNNSTQASSSSQSPGFSGSAPMFDYVREGIVGRLNYDYAGKYLLEASFRQDGSSKFARGHRWGFFPAISGGWRISEEPFFKDNINLISNLKLRASYGKLGDDASSRFQYLSGYDYPGPNYVLGNSLTSGLSPRGLANENLTWYTSELADVGLDADLWEGKFHAEFDIFRRKRTGLLADRALSLPGTVGVRLPQENLNSDLQQGLEISLGHKNQIGQIRYNISGNISFTRSKSSYIERAASNNSYNDWRSNNTNRWSDIYWGYHVIGQFKSMDEIRKSPVQDGNGNRNLLPGDLKYEDVNHDGVIDDNDVRPIGRNSSTPGINFGFTLGAQWKGFDLNMLFQGASNFTIDYLGSDQLARPLPWGRNGLDIFMDRWHREDMFDNKSDNWVPGKYPSTRPNGSAPWNYYTSDFWLHDATYLRLKSIELGYTLPASILERAGIKAFRVYANGFNLLTWSGLNSVVDPEHTKNTYGYEYPITRNYNIGLNVTF